MIEIDVEGRAAPKGSRIQGKTKTGRSYTFPASRFEKPWTEAVKSETQIATRHASVAKPYAIELEFRLKPPKKERDRRYAWPTGSDLDKLERCVVDGLVQGGALEDDRHVTALTSRKRFCADGEAPGVHIRVSEDAQMQGVRAAA